MTRSPRVKTVRMGPIMALPALLKELGVDPLDVLAEAEIDPQVFSNPDNIISFATRVRLINICVKRTAVPHFGLLLAQTNSLQNFGLRLIHQ